MQPGDVVQYAKSFLQRVDINPTDPMCFAIGDVVGRSPSGELVRVDWNDPDMNELVHPSNLTIAGTLEPQ